MPDESVLDVGLSGIHARSERLVELTRQYDRGSVPWEHVEDQMERETRELIRLQEKVGCQYISDGALGWKDQLRPITQCIDGLAETTRYSRWFDTNTFYQKPIVISAIRFKEFEPTYFLQTRVLSRDTNWTVAMPGPWTLSELSENKFYSSREDLLRAYGKVLKEIVVKLSEIGVRHIQLSEPSLVYWPYREKAPNKSELSNALDCIRELVTGVDVAFSVQTFFGDASPILNDLLGLPVSAVSVDLYETPLGKLPKHQSEMKLTLGIVDSEESFLERPEWIVDTVRTIERKIGNGNFGLAPNTDLKFVPRSIADQKLESLAAATSVLKRTGRAF